MPGRIGVWNRSRILRPSYFNPVHYTWRRLRSDTCELPAELCRRRHRCVPCWPFRWTAQISMASLVQMPTFEEAVLGVERTIGSQIPYRSATLAWPYSEMTCNSVNELIKKTASWDDDEAARRARSQNCGPGQHPGRDASQGDAADSPSPNRRDITSSRY